MFRSIILAALLTVLVVSTASASHQAVDPVGSCSAVTVEALPTGAYTVTATGWGQWAQIVDVNGVITRTDFGAGTTTFAWPDLALAVGAQYQVQVSRFETTGYSTTGCIFNPPEPQAITIDRFEYIGDAFEWDAIQDGLGYWVIDANGGQWTRWTPAQSPGNWGWFQYRVYPWARTIPAGEYILMGQDVTGLTGEAARLTYKGR